MLDIMFIMCGDLLGIALMFGRFGPTAEGGSKVCCIVEGPSARVPEMGK
jgi:hypothetical protein